MGAVDIILSTSGSLADLVLELERDNERKIFRRVSRDILPPVERVLGRILETPAPPRGPERFVWSLDPVRNARGRRAFFAKYPNGFTRTNTLVKAWVFNAQVLPDGTVIIMAFNPSNGASYVFGSDEFDQVPGHKTTGWPLVSDAITDAGAEIEDMVEQMWFEYVEAGE